ncbi:MAG: hypothetical protein N4J56_000281 [Chroococcidiopsis sp. SAG 2025]|uniref:hypothetical protein n=1 Tax=Chroococcidiopsis sp. SAG 2025 TaxID=171389 RepID=UPI0029370163|nr:hypothetical protein [Chroococcidiopsis sp. SAG 2025]MDV2990627.1 hypothetical protein [Chroococcidiopsis sp. SAG 2025]
MAIDIWIRYYDEYIYVFLVNSILFLIHLLRSKPNYFLEQVGLYSLAFYLYTSLYYMNLLIIATSNFAELDLLLKNNPSFEIAGIGAGALLLLCIGDLCSKVGRCLGVFYL